MDKMNELCTLCGKEHNIFDLCREWLVCDDEQRLTETEPGKIWVAVMVDDEGHVMLHRTHSIIELIDAYPEELVGTPVAGYQSPEMTYTFKGDGCGEECECESTWGVSFEQV